MTSPKDVVDNHIRCFNQADIQGILDDYAEGAVLFTPLGALQDKVESEALFQKLVSEFYQPGFR